MWGAKLETQEKSSPLGEKKRGIEILYIIPPPCNFKNKRFLWVSSTQAQG